MNPSRTTSLARQAYEEAYRTVRSLKPAARRGWAKTNSPGNSIVRHAIIAWQTVNRTDFRSGLRFPINQDRRYDWLTQLKFEHHVYGKATHIKDRIKNHYLMVTWLRPSL